MPYAKGIKAGEKGERIRDEHKVRNVRLDHGGEEVLETS